MKKTIEDLLDMFSEWLVCCLTYTPEAILEMSDHDFEELYGNVVYSPEPDDPELEKLLSADAMLFVLRGTVPA